MKKFFLWLLLALGLLAACGTPPNAATTPVQTNNASLVGGAPSASPTRAASPTHAAPTTASTKPPTTQPTSLPTSAPTRPIASPTSQPVQPSPSAAPVTVSPAPAASAMGSEILFLRGGVLIAYDVTAGSERQLAEGVYSFTATHDGAQIALVRGTGSSAELWLMNRDGSGLRQLTNNQRAEDTPRFAPDGQAIIFAAADADMMAGRTWADWSRWCRQSQVVVLDIASGSEQSMGAGCDPAISPDGKRIAFATAPSSLEQSSTADMPLAFGNAIRLVNRQGQNGWNFATAGDPAKNDSGRLVFAPAWSPDGRQLAYQRFVGYQALTDVLYTEMGNSFEGKGKKIDLGPGWMLAPRFAPNSTQIANIDYNAGDARGFEGYEIWSVRLLGLNGQRSLAMPEGETDFAASEVDRLYRAQVAAWSPDGASLAVQLPTGWQPGLAENEPLFGEEKPGELWLWKPGQQPEQKLADNIDFASQIMWLPATK